MQDEPATETQEDDHNDINIGERMTTMSPFERLMINRMDTFADNQRTSTTCVTQGSTSWIHAFLHWMSKLRKSRDRSWSYNLKGRIVLHSSLFAFNFSL